MKIVAINGSPKPNESASGMLIQQIEDILHTNATVFSVRKLLDQKEFAHFSAVLQDADVLLVVFPLYIDSLSAPLIKVLSLIEQEGRLQREVPLKVYAICNCGFYEAEHTRLALQMIERFAVRAGFNWGYGIGIGCGGMLLSLPGNLAKGPAANVHAVLRELCDEIAGTISGTQNVFVTPKFPRFLYKLSGNMGWNQMAKRNNVRTIIHARPHVDQQTE